MYNHDSFDRDHADVKINVRCLAFCDISTVSMAKF